MRVLVMTEEDAVIVCCGGVQHLPEGCKPYKRNSWPGNTI